MKLFGHLSLGEMMTFTTGLQYIKISARWNALIQMEDGRGRMESHKPSSSGHRESLPMRTTRKVLFNLSGTSRASNGMMPRGRHAMMETTALVDFHVSFWNVQTTKDALMLLLAITTSRRLLMMEAATTLAVLDLGVAEKEQRGTGRLRNAVSPTPPTPTLMGACS